MTWNYYQYLAANFGISFGLAFFSIVLMIALLVCRTDTFYLFIKLLFGIEDWKDHREAEQAKIAAQKQEGCCCCHFQSLDESNKQSCWCCWCCPLGHCFWCRSQSQPLKDVHYNNVLILNLYDEDSFLVPKDNTCVFRNLVCCKEKLRIKRVPYCESFCLKAALLIMIAAIFTAVFVVFFDGLILIVVSVDPNGVCPDEGPYDCYDNSPARTYFNCSSADLVVNSSLGRVTCYRWFKKDITTHDVLDQIGLCGGLMAAFGVFVIIFLRFNIYVLKQKVEDPSKPHVEQTGNGPQGCKDYCCCCNPGEFEFNDCCCFGLEKYVHQCIRQYTKGTSKSRRQRCCTRCCNTCCTSLQQFKRPELVIVWVIVLFVVVSGFIVAMVLVGQYPVSVTGMTYAILAAAFGVTAVAFPVFLVRRTQSDLKDAEERKHNKELIGEFMKYIQKKKREQPSSASRHPSSSSNGIVTQASNVKPTIGRDGNSYQPVRILAPQNSDRYVRSPPQENSVSTKTGQSQRT